MLDKVFSFKAEGFEFVGEFLSDRIIGNLAYYKENWNGNSEQKTIFAKGTNLKRLKNLANSLSSYKEWEKWVGGWIYEIEYPPLPQKLIDLCIGENDDKSCAEARRLIENNPRLKNKELEYKLDKKGCALGNVSSCRSLAYYFMRMNDVAKNNEGLSIYRKYCDEGYWVNCESLGYYLLKMGKMEEARIAYVKTCSSKDINSVFRGCEELGKLSETDALKTELTRGCEKKQNWSCMALIYLELSVKNLEKAQIIFVDRCKKESKVSDYFCEVASDRLNMPYNPDDN